MLFVERPFKLLKRLNVATDIQHFLVLHLASGDALNLLALNFRALFPSCRPACDSSAATDLT